MCSCSCFFSLLHDIPLFGSIQFFFFFFSGWIFLVGTFSAVLLLAFVQGSCCTSAIASSIHLGAELPSCEICACSTLVDRYLYAPLAVHESFLCSLFSVDSLKFFYQHQPGCSRGWSTMLLRRRSQVRFPQGPVSNSAGPGKNPKPHFGFLISSTIR